MRIKKMMLRTGPELEDLTDSLKSDQDDGNLYESYLDGRFMLRFMKDNRGLIEDINYQRLINNQKKKLSEISDDINLKSTTFKELVFKTLQEDIEYLHGLNIFYEATQEDHSLEKESLEEASKIIFDLHQDPVKSSIISESLRIIEQESLDLEGHDFESGFIQFAIRTTENISNYQFYKENIIDQIESFKNQITVNAKKELRSYLKSKTSNLEGAMNHDMNHIGRDFNRTNFDKVISICSKIDTFSKRDFLKDPDKIEEKIINGPAEYLDYYILLLKKLIRHLEISIEKKKTDTKYFNNYLNTLKKKTDLDLTTDNISSKISYLKKNIQTIERKYPEEISPSFVYSNSSNSNCFVVTATTGSASNIIVNDFRQFRDESLMSSLFGRALISVYYQVGPLLARIISHNHKLRKFILKYLIIPLHNLIK
jgi:hypothetical protein